MRWVTLISAGLSCFAAQAGAQGLELPAPATRTFEQVEVDGAYSMPVGPWFEGRIETLPLSGTFSLEAWRLAGNGHASQRMMNNLAGQLKAAGYEVLYQCADSECGGFDFRFGTLVAGEPKMHVDLGDYQYLAAHKPGEDGGDYTALLISRSLGAGFVQIARVGPARGEAVTIDNPTLTSTMTEPANQVADPDAKIAEQLELNGFAVLTDLVFETGSSDLGSGPFDSLSQLAAYLADHPDRSVALVGHTDAEGPLAINIILSKRRATSVRARLIEQHDLPGEQMVAEGVGFLAPLSSNLTDAGRTQNRRVEVVLTSTR
ncbi:MAG: OmpA family protein [Rhodobacteraceae bacterium]|nr:OmpA family protein [Paracoccaceae bacterium]